MSLLRKHAFGMCLWSAPLLENIFLHLVLVLECFRLLLLLLFLALGRCTVPGRRGVGRVLYFPWVYASAELLNLTMNPLCCSLSFCNSLLTVALTCCCT